jgi:cellulose synthase/poly-beta-1,6-N-acetylglucosamine synthase-like glycosyltransferase
MKSQTNKFHQGELRLKVEGKYFFLGDKKFYIRGVTYGPFRPDEYGNEFHTAKLIEQDFTQMAANGINAIRTYTVPPRWVFDMARRNNLWVMVGIPWEQHIAFLDDKKRVSSIKNRVREAVRACEKHPSILCYVIGNEIPASIVRWYGRRRVGNFLRDLNQIVKQEDPDGLVTYVNYPTTEYLQTSFLDFTSFNVYLEYENRFIAYLSRLQNTAGDKPLVMTEVGLDSSRNGEMVQANTLDWLISAAFSAGCAGVFVFAWTDEWYRGGYDIEDWDFGLTHRDRSPKPALTTVRQAFNDVPFPQQLSWPSVSVVVCSYNGEKTIRECLYNLEKLDYPNYEVIVVNDGSNDNTASIAESYNCRLITIDNSGLSKARNVGLDAAKGEFIAYLDDDAYPDPHWLHHISMAFSKTSHVGIGGPNISPPGDGLFAESVAYAPGNPTHVLLTDQEAEHIPGCNMAFRRAALEEVGGFDPQFHIAGDDVDICWQLHKHGGTLGFSPGAIVWHHRRNSLRAYLRQQFNYGEAEGLLAKKWPDKYNTIGHPTWRGRLYGNGQSKVSPFRRWKIYYGRWGSGHFQSLYEKPSSTFLSLTLVPEWYLVILVLALFSAIGALWQPLLLTLPLFALSISLPLLYAIMSTTQVTVSGASLSFSDKLRLRGLTLLLHLLQPLARLLGRLHASWYIRWMHSMPKLAFPKPREVAIWSEGWQSPVKWLTSFESALCEQGAFVVRGGDFDGWDLEIHGGLLGTVRMVMAIEEHGTGKQLIRFRSWPRLVPWWILMILLTTLLSFFAAIDQAWTAATILGTIGILLGMLGLKDCAAGTAYYLDSSNKVEKRLSEIIHAESSHRDGICATQDP